MDKLTAKTAWLYGRLAACVGRPLGENPCTAGTLTWESWNDGWHAGRALDPAEKASLVDQAKRRHSVTHSS